MGGRKQKGRVEHNNGLFANNRFLMRSLAKGRTKSKDSRDTRARTKTNLDSLLAQMRDAGVEPEFEESEYQSIIDTGLRSKNLLLGAVAHEFAYDQKPLTLRGLLYAIVSAGILPSTDKEHYKRLGRVVTLLRERGVMPFSWIVDNVRSTIKPSSWSGIADFCDTVKHAYRMDFWARLPEYCHVIVEKDAIAGTLAPTCREYDVALSPIRGYVSLSFAHEIAATWNQIEKPITCYYLGDFDASGFDLERDLREKLTRYCDRDFEWERLGVNHEDFDDLDLLPLAAKKSDKRYAAFVARRGHECAELDAIPAPELRRRVRNAIESHIPAGRWDDLKATEEAERKSFNEYLAGMGGSVTKDGDS